VKKDSIYYYYYQHLLLLVPAFIITTKNERQSSTVTGLGWPRGFQEVKVARLLDNGTVWW
jgi:hypothetical protein